MPITIKDIADSARVSPSTVSRALNQSGYVSAAARERIETAIEELQYQPSWVARTLRGKHSGLVGLIIPDILNVYYTSVSRSILENLNKKGYNLIIQVTNEDSDLELAYLRMLYDRKVDGIIYVPVADGNNSEFVRDLACKGVPMVELSRQRESDILDAVLADNFGGSYMAIERLRQLGHRRIAMIGGSMNSSTARDRFLGYKKALEDTGVLFDSNLAKMFDASKAWGIQAAQELLQLEPRPTAMFAASNQLLVGVMTVLTERKVKVPDDVSIISFDDSDWLSFWQPPITTVDIAVDEMGMLAVQLLMRRIEDGKAAEKPVTYRLSVNLVQRGSCRPISK